MGWLPSFLRANPRGPCSHFAKCEHPPTIASDACGGFQPSLRANPRGPCSHFAKCEHPPTIASDACGGFQPSLRANPRGPCSHFAKCEHPPTIASDAWGGFQPPCAPTLVGLVHTLQSVNSRRRSHRTHGVASNLPCAPTLVGLVHTLQSVKHPPTIASDAWGGFQPSLRADPRGPCSHFAKCETPADDRIGRMVWLQTLPARRPSWALFTLCK